MCERTRPRFLCLYLTKVLGQNDFTMLDCWMDENVPEEYRVVSVMQEKMVSDEITIVWTIVCELK
jgi:hypothetical protein